MSTTNRTVLIVGIAEDGTRYKKLIEAVTADAIYLVKVGDRDRPAATEDLADVTKQIAEAVSDKSGKAIIICHHAIAFDVLRIF